MKKSLDGHFFDVFLSYAKEDFEAADRLYNLLKEIGYTPAMDKRDVIGGDKWEERLEQLQQHASKLIFLISEHSTRSVPCQDELNLATKLGVQIIPVRLDDTPANQLPEQVRELQYIRLSRPEHWTSNLSKIEDAIRLNLDWENDRPFYLERAARGELLATKDSVRGMERWLAARPATSAPPPEQLFTLIDDSRRRLDRTRTFVFAAIGVVLVCLSGAFAWALVERNNALENERTAEQRAARLITERAPGQAAAGGFDLALLRILDASNSFDNANQIGDDFLISMEETIRGAFRHSVQLIPNDTESIPYQDTLFLHSPSHEMLYRVGPTGEMMSLGPMSGQLLGVFDNASTKGAFLARRLGAKIEIFDVDPISTSTKSFLHRKIFTLENLSTDFDLISIRVNPDGVGYIEEKDPFSIITEYRIFSIFDNYDVSYDGLLQYFGFNRSGETFIDFSEFGPPIPERLSRLITSAYDLPGSSLCTTKGNSNGFVFLSPAVWRKVDRALRDLGYENSPGFKVHDCKVTKNNILITWSQIGRTRVGELHQSLFSIVFSEISQEAVRRVSSQASFDFVEEKMESESFVPRHSLAVATPKEVIITTSSLDAELEPYRFQGEVHSFGFASLGTAVAHIKSDNQLQFDEFHRLDYMEVPETSNPFHVAYQEGSPNIGIQPRLAWLVQNSGHWEWTNRQCWSLIQLSQSVIDSIEYGLNDLDNLEASFDKFFGIPKDILYEPYPPELAQAVRDQEVCSYLTLDRKYRIIQTPTGTFVFTAANEIIGSFETTHESILQVLENSSRPPDILVSNNDFEVRLWSTEPEGVYRPTILFTGQDRVTAAALTPDRRRMVFVTGGRPRQLVYYSLSAEQIWRILERDWAGHADITFARSGDIIAEETIGGETSHRVHRVFSFEDYKRLARDALSPHCAYEGAAPQESPCWEEY